MSIYKNIEPENVLISSFKTYKTFTFTEADSGSGVYAIPIIKGTDSNLYNFSGASAGSKTISASVFYKVPTYHNINNLYYKDIIQMRAFLSIVRVIFDLRDLQKEVTHNLWKEVEDGKGRVHVLVTITGTTRGDSPSNLANWEEDLDKLKEGWTKQYVS